MQVQVNGTSFYRDTQSMALVNKDSVGLQDYMIKRRFAESQKQEINNLKNEFECIKSDMKDIKELMLKLLDKGTNNNG